MGTLQMVTKTVLIAILVTIISGCARTTPWRTNLKEDCSVCEDENCIIEEEQDQAYTLGFLEFTERGNLYNVKAREEILNRIQEDAKSEKGVLVVVLCSWMES